MKIIINMEFSIRMVVVLILILVAALIILMLIMGFGEGANESVSGLFDFFGGLLGLGGD
jgi:hypothetical protein